MEPSVEAGGVQDEHQLLCVLFPSVPGDRRLHVIPEWIIVKYPRQVIERMGARFALGCWWMSYQT